MAVAISKRKRAAISAYVGSRFRKQTKRLGSPVKLRGGEERKKDQVALYLPNNALITHKHRKTRRSAKALLDHGIDAEVGDEKKKM